MVGARDLNHNRIKYFVTSQSQTDKEFLSQIASGYLINTETAYVKIQNYLDTFDFRLYKKGLTLSKESKSYHLSKLNLAQSMTQVIDRSKVSLRFWWDLPDCPLGKELKSCIDVRALLPVVDIRRHITKTRVLNKDEKTVAFLSIQNISLSDNGKKKLLINMLSLAPVRGYDREFNRIKSNIERSMLKECGGDVFGMALESIGKEPSNYSSKLNFALASQMPASRAFKNILSNLLQTMKLNEYGMKEDIDTEFLHDFRVAVRRARSLLTLIKGVFPEDVTSQLKMDFARLGKMTNLLRDLDVYLLKRQEYLNIIPEDMRLGLNYLFDEILCKKRKEAHKGFVKSLAGYSYKSALDTLDNFLKEQPIRGDKSTFNLNTPIIELAKKTIWKRYKKVIKTGRQIDDESPDPVLHKLRIECKKLRYCLEFFACLFPDKEMEQIIKQMKRLQDNLGDFNDLYVQQQSLKSFIQEFDSGKDEYDRNCAIAAGGLISILHRKQKQARSLFSNRFEQFSINENKALFKKLFSNDEVLA